MSLEFSKATQICRWSTSRFEHWAPIPIRLMVGYGFMALGYAKPARGPEHFVEILHGLGAQMPELTAWVIIVVEHVGRLAVLMGAFLPPVSIPMATTLLVSMFTVLLPNGFLTIKLQAVTSTGVQLGKPGYEVDLWCLKKLTPTSLLPSSEDSLFVVLGARCSQPLWLNILRIRRF